VAYVPLATVTDLSALGVDTTNTALVASLLDSVSSEVREAAGVPITLETATVTLPGVRGQLLTLPGGPVRSVTSVTLAGVAVTDHKLRDGRLWRLSGWGCVDDDVVVTYSHGFDTVPSDVVRLVCMLVAAGVNNAGDGFGASRGKAYESIDDYRVGYLQGDAEVIDPTALPERTRAMLRARFGGGVYVTGSFE